jgi:hypothetical protein
MTFFLSPTEAATISIEMMAYRSDRRGEKPVTWLAFQGPFATIGSPRVDFHYGQERASLHQQAGDTCAV